ncbi:sugar phosphate isomerase/epimerase family protein [Peterkaempfera bronchialis]|nr:TIM barrel protein [Peterkaempfera bronchialis]
MELSIITDEVSQDPEEAARLAVRHGVRHVAIRSVWGQNIAECDDARAEGLADVLRQYGIGVSSVLSPLFKCHPGGAPEDELVDPHFVGFPPVFASHMRQAHRLPVLAGLLGAPTVRIFTFIAAAPAGGVLPGPLRDTITSAVENWEGTRAAVENEHICHVRTLRELEEFCSATGLGAVVDPCNQHVASDGDGLKDLSEELVRSAVDIHVKDRRNGQYVPVGRGELRWQPILERLEELGYVGPITLESHLRGDLEGITESIRTLRRWGVA